MTLASASSRTEDPGRPDRPHPSDPALSRAALGLGASPALLNSGAWDAGHFTNPILPPHSADPWITRRGEWYYFCEAGDHNTSVRVRRSRSIFDVGAAEAVRVWTAPPTGPCSQNLWAPELHFLDGRWYIYIAADDGRNRNHRMWVLESEGEDPQGVYQRHGPLETEGWAIDGTVFRHRDGLYFVWSGWPGKRDGLQNLYLAPMRTPLELAGPRRLLTTPDQPWERREMPICEGPQVLQRDGTTCIIYSASASWTEHYCLGLLAHRSGDILETGNWQKSGPVLAKSAGVWGVGHCSFTVSPCGYQDWILFHSKSRRSRGWNDRDVHAQPFSWRPGGLPDFGVPLGRAVPISRCQVRGPHASPGSPLIPRLGPQHSRWCTACALTV